MKKLFAILLTLGLSAGSIYAQIDETTKTKLLGFVKPTEISLSSKKMEETNKKLIPELKSLEKSFEKSFEFKYLGGFGGISKESIATYNELNDKNFWTNLITYLKNSNIIDQERDDIIKILDKIIEKFENTKDSNDNDLTKDLQEALNNLKINLGIPKQPANLSTSLLQLSVELNSLNKEIEHIMNTKSLD